MHPTNRRLLFIVLICLAFVVSGFADQPPALSYDAAKLIWKITGGGQIHFSVKPENGKYKIEVADSGGFQKSDWLVDDNQEVAKALNQIFNHWEKFKVAPQPKTNTRTSHSPQPRAGTWTRIKMILPDGTASDLNLPKEIRQTIYSYVTSTATKHSVSPSMREPPPIDPGLLSHGLAIENKPENTAINRSDAFYWETVGGGQIRFSLHRIDDRFQVQVYQFGPYQEQVLEIARTHDKPYQAANAIFANWKSSIKKRNVKTAPNLRDKPKTDIPQPLSGTWTKLLFVSASGDWAELQQRDDDNNFRAIYEFVSKSAEELPLPPSDHDEPPTPPQNTDKN